MSGFQTLWERGSSLRTGNVDPAKIHETPAIIESVSLESRLRTNKGIIAKNDERREKKALKEMGISSEDASLIASWVTVTNDEYEDIRRTPELFEHLKDLLPAEALIWMRRKNAEEKQALSQTETGIGPSTCSTPVTDVAPGGHVWAKDVVEVERDQGRIHPTSFPKNIFVAANHGYIPLGLFHSTRVRRLQTISTSINPRIFYPENKKTKI
ncbi:hypothetical protein VKT23_002870 [Stygiomarasmius scandens]|uniref:Uncharacterized protein n=1 Tax=Marasmiellus scandens TaxID=2682957 RepID=A0ABR1JW09_9AGAR